MRLDELQCLKLFTTFKTQMCLLGELIDKYEKKLFSRVEGWKLQGGKINPVYSIVQSVTGL